MKKDMEARINAFRLQSEGRLVEAAAAYRQLVERDPDDFESWNNLGNVHRAAGDLEAAIAALERAVAVAPAMPMVHLNLAGALVEAGRLQESLAETVVAARLAPDDVACQVELSRAHARLGDPNAALPPLERAAALLPAHAGIRLELGLLHAAVGNLAQAEAAYREVMRVQPGRSPAWLYLGILLEHSNRADELPALLAEAEANRVPSGDLALVRAFRYRREGDFHAALTEGRSANPAVEPLRRAQLIGEAADRLGDSGAAFAAFEEMNAVAAADLPGAREGAAVYRAEIESLLWLTTPAWYAGWSAVELKAVRPSPIFLVGFPRSGTTLLDTVLMGHSRLHVVEEKPLLQPSIEKLGGMTRLAGLDNAEASALRALYFETLDSLDPPSPGKIVVDKMPLNIARLPLIHRLFPDARIIFSLRDPRDVVLSCFITSFALNYAMANFLDLEDAARLYDLTMRYWERCRQVFPLDVHEVRYETMVEDLEGSVRPLLGFLGLPWEEGLPDHRPAAAARGYIASASYAQVTEPIYGRARGRWTRYRAPMNRVLPLLDRWAKHFGYDV